ncbi:MAG: hypothetical protein ABEI98_10290 [Halorhabdus sp.]
MAVSNSPLSTCPACGSDDRERIGTDQVPGGIDWRYFACEECGHEWRV